MLRIISILCLAVLVQGCGGVEPPIVSPSSSDLPQSITFSMVEQGDEITLSSTAECGDMADYTLSFINNYDAPGCRMTIKATFPISCRQEDEHTISCGRGE